MEGGREEGSLKMLWVPELGSEFASPGVQALCALFWVHQTFGFPEAIIKVGRSGSLPSCRADSFLTWFLTPARFCIHCLRTAYRAKEDYPLNNHFFKNLGIINNGEATAGFPLGEGQKSSRAVLLLAHPELKPHGVENARRILPGLGTQIKVIK